MEGAWRSGNPLLILEAAAFAALYAFQLGLLVVVAGRFFGRLLWRAIRWTYRRVAGIAPVEAPTVGDLPVSPIDELVAARRRALERVAGGHLTMVAASSQLGVSRSHLYDLRRRYLRDGEAALRPRRTATAR